jgi:tetratricopeptide (TPR) repeat protein
MANSADERLVDAALLMARGSFDAALPMLQQLTAAQPASAAAWKARGVAENKLGRPHEARLSLSESLRLDASDADAWSSLGGVHVTLGEHAEALAAFEAGLERDPASSYSLLNALTMAALVGDFDAARRRHAERLEAGLQRCEAQAAAGENLPWCWYDLAQIHFLLGATAAFRHALGLAVQGSSDWQITSARRTYELLAGSRPLGVAANAALADFAQLQTASRPPGH